MPNLIIGRSQKRINSTSRVMNAGGTTLSCKLKEPCSMQTPVFQVQGLTKGTLYNYAKFEDNYYWVDDVVYLTNNIQEVHCHLDPLATFRDDIKESKGLVIYGSAANWDKFVDDGRFQPEIFSKSQAGIGDEAGMFGLNPGGCVIMTFTQTSSVSWLDPDQTAVTDCGIHVALMSMSAFKDCIADLNNFNVTGGIIEIAQAFGRAFAGGSLLDNILRVIWLPFDYDDVVAKCCSGSDYKFGLMLGGVLNDHTPWYELPAAAMYTHTGSFTVDWDTLTDSLSFLRHDRWLSLQINNAGGFMSVPIDRFTNASDTLYYKTAFCLADGSWSFKISSSNTYRDTLVSNSGNCSVNLMGTVYMGPTTSNMIADTLAKFEAAAVALGVGTVVAGVATGGGIKSAATGISGGVNAFGKGIISAGELAKVSVGEALTQQQMAYGMIGTGIMGSIPRNSSSATCTTGSFNGGASGIFLNGSTPGQLYFYAQCWKPLFLHQDPTQYEAFCNEYGYPVNRYMKIGDNTGYVMCASANVSHIYGASEANKATINNFLNNGIYIEE